MAFGWKVMLPLALVAVMWSAVAVMVADAFDSPVAYGIAAGVFFVIVVAGGLSVLQRSGQLQGSADEQEARRPDHHGRASQGWLMRVCRCSAR